MAPGSRRVGLVLGGGGGKGSYQAGVFRALTELGYDRFEFIAGTSIGSLNAIFFATATPGEAEKLWLGLGDVLKPGRRFLIASAAYLWAYGLVLLPVAGLILGAAAFLGQRFLPSLATSAWVRWPPYVCVVSFVAVVASSYHARTFELGGMKVTYVVDPHRPILPLLLLMQPVGAIFAVTRTWDLRADWLVLLAGVTAACAWPYGAYWWLRRTRAYSLFGDDPIRDLISDKTRRPPSSWRAGRIFATVTRETTFCRPMHQTEHESETMKQAFGLQDRRGKLYTDWVACYQDLGEESPEDRLKTILMTAAIPIALPVSKDRSGRWLCDGGLVDNVPLCASPSIGECDLVIVVPLNQSEALSHEELQDYVDQKWGNRAVPDLTAEQVDAMEAAMLAAGEDWRGPWWRHVPGRRKIDPAKIVMIRPSKPLCVFDFWGIRFLTGTMNFAPAWAERWMKLGYDDAMAKLKPLSSA